jgi:hypothetical protein
MQPQELQRLEDSNFIIYRLALLLNPQIIARSFYFYIIWLLLLNSVVVCTYRRIKGHLSAQKNTRFIKPVAISNHENSFNCNKSDSKTTITEITDYLKTKRWRINHKEDDLIIAGHGKIGFWGSILFHLSLILLFIGAVITGITRLDAQILLTEGYSIPLIQSVVRMQKPLVGQLPQGEIISLKKIETHYSKEEILTDIYAKLVVGDYGAFEKKTSRVNGAVNFNGYSIMPKSYGIAPNFSFVDLKKNQKADFNINLGDWLPERWVKKGVFDSFILPNTGLKVIVQFVPNLKIVKGKTTSHGKLVKNPALILKVVDKQDKKVADGLLKQGQSMDFNNYRLKFNRLDYWGAFTMVRDSGLPIVVFSLVLAIIGLSIRFVFYEKKLQIIIGKKTGKGLKVNFTGKAQYFPALFNQEINKIKEDLTEILESK